MRLTWLALLYAGCPYLWDPPEYADSGVPPPGSDTSSPDTSSGTADTAPPVDPPPVIDAFTATFRFHVIELRFEVSDPEGDLEGALFSLSIDGIVVDHPAAELDSWDGRVGTRVLLEPASCEPFSHDYALVVTDAGGHASAEARTSLSLTPIQVPEEDEPIALGTVSLPAILCADHGNRFDEDVWELEVEPGGEWSVALVHPDEVDRDLSLTDQEGEVLASSEDLSVPDGFRFPFVEDTVYRLRTEQTQSGSGADYMVVISQ